MLTSCHATTHQIVRIVDALFHSPSVPSACGSFVGGSAFAAFDTKDHTCHRSENLTAKLRSEIFHEQSDQQIGRAGISTSIRTKTISRRNEKLRIRKKADNKPVPSLNCVMARRSASSSHCSGASRAQRCKRYAKQLGGKATRCGARWRAR